MSLSTCVRAAPQRSIFWVQRGSRAAEVKVLLGSGHTRLLKNSTSPKDEETPTRSCILGTMIGTPPPLAVVKEYPPRGPLQQVRFVGAIEFHCFRRTQIKKSRLVALYGLDWNKKLCNGCYGRLLSIYEVKSGTDSDDDRAQALATILLELARNVEAVEALKAAGIDRPDLRLLERTALLFLGTATFVARSLEAQPTLEWSPAVVGLCKALEFEAAAHVMVPWRAACEGHDLTADIADKDFRRVARYCARQVEETPELGTVAYTLAAIGRSVRRAEHSELIRALHTVSNSWSGRVWMLDAGGFALDLNLYVKDYRNRAAHTDELARSDFDSCWERLVGGEGTLWQLASATT